jgi:hypothetical protein
VSAIVEDVVILLSCPNQHALKMKDNGLLKLYHRQDSAAKTMFRTSLTHLVESRAALASYSTRPHDLCIVEIYA